MSRQMVGSSVVIVVWMLFDGLGEVVAPGVECVFVGGGVVGER